jgi:spore photoproduct lyase
MPGTEYFPQKIFIEKESLNFPLTRRILKNASRVPVEIIADPENLIDKIKSLRDEIGEGKRYILLTRQRGRFIKPCPCTPHYLGCNYFIINLDLNCPLGCSYCVLQQYLANPMISVHVNVDDLWRELDIFLERKSKKVVRIGTGELADSLALDHLTENSSDLISHFRGKRNAILELKTKTINVKNILKTEPAQNVVIAWSLNSAKIAGEEEKGAPAVEERINAARSLSEKGFWVAFHFDPIIRYPGWEGEYEEVIRKLLKAVDPGLISWISLGSLRFVPILKTIIKARFPRTKFIYEEFVKGKDGKIRYFRPLRLELYKEIVGFIKKWGGRKIRLYLCMENKEIWQEVMGWVPRGKESLEAYLAFPLGSSRKK